jgi:putative DNA primase/helicase
LEELNAPTVTRPGISPATLAKLDIRHIDEKAAFELLGQKFAGLYIPYGIHVEGKPFGRLRLDKPEADRKYTQRVGSGVHPYFPAAAGLEAQEDLVIVEGEFKAIALCEAGFRAIGISGFYGFQQEGEMCPRLVKHLKEHPPRRILFLGDNDTALNFQFADAAVKLTAMAGSVPVALPRIPMAMPKGVDDCREQLGAEAFVPWWQGLVAAAIAVPPKLRADMLAAELFKAALPDLKGTSGVERALVLQKLGRLASCLQPLARGEMADLCKAELGINKSTLQQAAAVALAEKNTPRTTKEEWKSSAELYGTPVFISKDGKMITGLNERFWAGLIREQNLILHEPNEGTFYGYDETSGLWKPESRARLEQLVCDTVHAESDGNPDYLKHAQLTFASAVVGHLKGMNERRHAFTGDPEGIHVANGYLVLGPDSVELHDFSPHYYSRNRSPIAFDPKARCPRFIEEVLKPALDPEDIALLQYLAGQCLLGRNLMQTILILVGPGGASKGTICNILQALIGEENCYELRTEHLEERFELFRYIGKTMLYGADVEPEFLRRSGATALKKLVGDDLVSPEGKNSNEKFNMRGVFNVIITCNKRLSVRLAGDVGAWRRRLRIIAFKKPVEGRQTIVNFNRMLIEEEGAGILNWAVRGAAQVLADKRANRTRPLSAAQHERIETLLGQSDSMRLFLELRVEKRHGEVLEKNDLLEAYADYCGEQSWEPLPELAARKELNNRMLELFGAVERKSAGGGGNQRGYSNVAFRDAASAEEAEGQS